MADVQLRELTKSYGATVALRDVSLDARENEFVSLLGPSGCGKTTTLRIILGFILPDTGTIHIGGEDMTAVPPMRRGIGMVFQNYALWPHMTVFENIAYGLRVRRVPQSEVRQRVSEMLERVQLLGLEERYPAQLSGGQQQRVALARALVIRPSVLLLDEPLSNLDRKLRDDMRLELKQLHKTFRQTTIYVTHDQEEALSLSDRVVVMNSGRIEQVGTPREIYHSPTAPFVARFIGKASFLPVTIRHPDALGRSVLVMRDGTAVHVAALRGGERFRAGQQAVLVVRPEEMAVVPSHQAPRDGTLIARIREHLFLGEVLRYQADLRDGSEVFVDSRQPLAPDSEGCVGLRIQSGCLIAD